MSTKRLLSVLVAFLAVLAPALAQEEAAATGAQGGFLGSIDAGAGHVVSWLGAVFFFDIAPGSTEIPLVVAWLVLGAIYFTVRMRFVNLRGFSHAIQVTRGRYTDPNAHGTGEVSHFQALASALSATVPR